MTIWIAMLFRNLARRYPALSTASDQAGKWGLIIFGSIALAGIAFAALFGWHGG